MYQNLVRFYTNFIHKIKPHRFKNHASTILNIDTMLPTRIPTRIWLNNF